MKLAESKDPKSTDLDPKDPELTYLDLLGEHHRRTAIQLVKQFSVSVKDYLYDKQEKDHNVVGYLLRPLKDFWQRSLRALTIHRTDDGNQSSDEPETSRLPSTYSASQMEEGKLNGGSLTGCPASQTPSQPGTEGSTLKPLEITFCLSAYVATLQKFSLDGPTTGGLLGSLDLLVEAFTDLEKVSSNKIPFSYRCQMWGWIVLYLFFLPFQIWRPLGYLTIPATSIASFVFLGLHAAGEEIENPFDNDPNDLRLGEDFCKPLSNEITRLEYPSDFDSNPQQPWASSNQIGQILKAIETNQEENKKTKAWIKEGFNKFGTILGFVISFRTSSAIERYDEGRRLLASITHATRTFARIVRFVIPDKPVFKQRHDDERQSKQSNTPKPTFKDILGEDHRDTAIQLVNEFSTAVKGYLSDKFRQDMEKRNFKLMKYVSKDIKPSLFRESEAEAGQLGRKIIPESKPLEITFYLSSYVAALQEFEIEGPIIGALLTAIDQLVESYTDLQKVSMNKIPFSYRFQLWGWIILYLLLLPFQLWRSLRYLTIPGVSLAAFIFLGLHSAGEEIENNDPNDLNLDEFCKLLTAEIKELQNSDQIDAKRGPWKSSGRIKEILPANQSG
ncbi:similar to domain membrane protein [Rhizoctonia solani]|uniref:Similar to domain membrane protein n=1 Tax=Rhizoctonia solani TaxID=456999 RepID=A0A0K6G6B6_9AGAM|nr:similar to domain membrane protein [Rhizoctonia solani]